MRNYLLLLVSLLLTQTSLLAQWIPTSSSPVGNLNSEEVRLIQAFRANPEPFRNVLFGQGGADVPTPSLANLAVLGPRDVIDVTVSGGKIAFYGKRREYSPPSIRLVRGETSYIIFGMENSAIETRVKVSYRADGFHFDIREPYGKSSALPRGFIVVPESKEWKTGDIIKWTGALGDAQSLSKAENIGFNIRYVSR